MKIEVAIEPLPQSRPRFSKRGHCYEKPEMTAYKSAIATVAKSAMCGLQPYSCPVEVTLRLWRKYKNTSRRYGDCDNHLKSIMDALNGVVYLDDAQIISASVKKIQSTTPKVEVEIRPVEEVN